jgi:hypothetical protein
MIFFPATLPPAAPIEIRAAVESAPREPVALLAARRVTPGPAAKSRVEIGSRWVDQPTGPASVAPDAQRLQDALLDERTAPAYPRSLLASVLGAFWAWA